MEKSQLYINKALIIFKQEGLRLSIDELALKMGISKKTLYNNFHSKEALLSDCIKHVFADLNNNMKMLHDDNYNAIECMYQSFHELNIFFQDHSPVFINDLHHLYPEMINDKHTSGFGQFRGKLILNMKKGIKEGLYSKDMDIDLISAYFVHSVFGFFFQSVITSNAFSTTNYFETMITYNLRALVTEKGRKLLKLNTQIKP